MVNSTNIFWYLLDKMPTKARAQRNFERDQRIKKQDELRNQLNDALGILREDAKENEELTQLINSILKKYDTFSTSTITEHEQKIIDISLCRLFFSTQTSEIVQKMMDAILRMNVKKYLYDLTIYTECVESFLRDEIQKRLRDGNTKYLRYFNIGDLVGQWTNIFSELFKQFSELKREYEEMHRFFFAQYSIHAIVSGHDFRMFTDFMNIFNTRIQETATIFRNNKEEFISFVDHQIKSLTAFQFEVDYQHYEECCGDSDIDNQRKFCDALPEPPGLSLKERLEASLIRIRQIEV